VAFGDLARFQHQVEFLASAATIQAKADGTACYRERIANNYFNSLSRAPSAEAKKAIAAAMDETKAGLAKARLTYTIQFPGKIARRTVQAVLKHLKGEELPKEILIDTALYRKADAEKDPTLK